jgi:lysine decarboxylase
LLIDRNCHKSLAHLLMMSDVVPLWLTPTRNALGILGGIPRREFTHAAIERKVANLAQASWPHLREYPGGAVRHLCPYQPGA